MRQEPAADAEVRAPELLIHIGKQESTALRRLVNSVQRAVLLADTHATASSPECIDTIQDELRRFLGSGELRQLVESELARMACQPGYSPLGSRANSLFLADSDEFLLSMSLVYRERVAEDKIFGLPASCFFANPSTSPISVGVRDIPDDCDLGVFDARHVLSAPRRLWIAPNESVFLDASKVVVQYEPDVPLLLIKLTLKRSEAKQVWVYGRATGVPLMVSSSSLLASRLQMVSWVLGELLRDQSCDPEESITLLRALAFNPHHFVRWSALQAICKVDVGEGIDLLKRATTDAHPLVREGASRALQMITSAGLPLEE